jgi:hypothetical protein
MAFGIRQGDHLLQPIALGKIQAKNDVSAVFPYGLPVDN